MVSKTLLISLLFFTTVVGILGQNVGNTGPSSTPIALTPPNLPAGVVAVNPKPGPFFQGFKPPFPTTSWWTGFTVDNQDSRAAGPFPFQAVTRNTGIAFGISDSGNRRFDGTWLELPTQYDWSVGFAGLPNSITNRKALSWDTQTVCLQYFNTDGSTTMKSCLIPGSPYMTFSFTNASVVINSQKGGITSFQWVAAGTKAKVINSGGTYIIYSINGPITLTQQGYNLVSPVGFTGTLRMAKLNETSQEAILDASAATYATGLVMSYAVANDVSTQTWTWNVVGTASKLLILSYPHHRKVLQAPIYASIQYQTLKGYMKGVLGNKWTLKHSLPTISWFTQNPPQASCLSELNKTLEYEVNALQVLVPNDFYIWGGSWARASQLATIAEHIGRMDLVPKVLNILKQSVAYLFDPTRKLSAKYETGWGGVVNSNFSNDWYNDHHFSFGYFLHGAAVIGKYDPVWLQQNLDFFTHIARDIGNPSPTDPHYTVTRCMDWFAGHSWASGIANGAGARSQESSSEAINGYYGLLLFAKVTNNTQLVNYARMLLAIEIAGAQAYWHLYPTTTDADTPYPEQGFRALTTVGMVQDWRSGAWIYWGYHTSSIQIAGIQILPLTPIGQYFYDKNWMTGVLPYCEAELNDLSRDDAFKSVIYAAYAPVNPQAAYNYSSWLSLWGSGNSASNQLYFVSTQNSTTNICSGVQHTPEGVYYIQDVTSGLYLTVAKNGDLVASTAANALATKFQLVFVPGQGAIRALSNGLYVTTSPYGNSSLSAKATAINDWELVRWKLQSDGTYQLKAMVNKAAVSTISGTKSLINDPALAASSYRLVTAPNSAAIPASGKLQSKQSMKYVLATTVFTTLRASELTAVTGTVFSFEKVQNPNVDPPYYTIKNTVTGKFVTGNDLGTIPLKAERTTAAGWEYFRILPYQGYFIIVHVVTEKYTALQADTTLIDNSSSTGDEVLWSIV